MCKKKWLWGVRTILLQAKALAGASILRTPIIHPPMISTLTILELMVSMHLISTLTIAWALGLGAFAPKRGAICAPPAAPNLSGGYGGLRSDYRSQHCERSPRLPPILSGAIGGYGQTETPDSASIAPGCPPQGPA